MWMAVMSSLEIWMLISELPQCLPEMSTLQSHPPGFKPLPGGGGRANRTGHVEECVFLNSVTSGCSYQPQLSVGTPRT